jgi:Pyrimidine dimer DNA glycosylase
MQTFLNSYSLAENAKVIDNNRLFKQLLEAKSLLDIIVNKKTGGYSNHPACLMWKENPAALFWYIRSIWEECQFREIAKKSELFNECISLIKQHDPYFMFRSDIPKFPDWWGREDIISSHRSRLLCKGAADVYCALIKKALKIKNMDRWLKEEKGRTKNQLKYADVLNLKRFIDFMKIPVLGVNHYEQFGWTDDPSAEYVWPISIN